jgi:hypothetical protein
VQIADAFNELSACLNQFRIKLTGGPNSQATAPVLKGQLLLRARHGRELCGRRNAAIQKTCDTPRQSAFALVGKIGWLSIGQALMEIMQTMGNNRVDFIFRGL